MKLFIQVILVLSCAIGVSVAQPVQFNPLNGPDGAYVEEFILNEQGDILVEQKHVVKFGNNGDRTGINISRDGGNNWTEISGSFSYYDFVAHPNGSFYTVSQNSDQFHKLPYGKDTVTILPINSLNGSGMTTFTIDENGTFFSINQDKEIFSSTDEGITWTFLSQGNWSTHPTKLIAPKSSDYIYVSLSRSGNASSGIHRLKKDGSEFDFIRDTKSFTNHNIYHKPGIGYALLNSNGVIFSENGKDDWVKIGPSNQGGTWNSNNELVIFTSTGVILSNDLGGSWSKVSDFTSYWTGYSGTFKIINDPIRNSNYVKNFTANTYNFFRANNDFTNWQPIAPKNKNPPISKVFVDGQNNIYAGVMLSGGTEIEGFHRSTDSGNTFQHLQANGAEIRSISEAGNGILFAMGHNDTLYRSADYGANWTESMPIGVLLDPQGLSRFSFVKGNKNGTIVVYFHNSKNGNIWYSPDNGGRWKPIDVLQYIEKEIAIHPDGSIYGSSFQDGDGTNLVKYDPQLVRWDTIFRDGSGISEIVISKTGVIYAKNNDLFSPHWHISGDGGNSFFKARWSNINSLTSATNGYLIAYQRPNVILSKNNGLSWKVIYTASENIYFWKDFHFSKDNFIYAAIEGQPIHKSEKIIYNDNFIVGNIFADKNKTCLYEQDDKYLNNILVTAEGLDTFYATTRSDGRFIIPVPAGDYDVKITLPSPLWEACDSVQMVSFSGINDSTFIDFGIKALVECPHLNVDLTTPQLRRCFENEYHVKYCNEGTVTATDALVEITLDSRFTVSSSQIPWTTVVGSTYTFPVGDVDLFECGNFSFKVDMVCDSVALDETICAEARISPDSICLSPSPNWSGASLQVSGECQGDSMIFIIKNVGTGDMISTKNYIVIEDVAIMRVSPPFQLPSGETERIAIEATGQTVHIEVSQVEGHPGFSAPSATLERCGTTSIQTGLFNQFGQNDLGNTVDIECRVVTGAYDPNDKQAVPTGRDEEHFIQPNSTIEYLIRFQNTGTDTAFNVFVLDTISTWLDITSLEVGAGSHEYDFEIYDNGILRFDFNNIMLPDSNVNQLASNGFIKYKIKLKKDAPLGTIIYNAADIYFDFNDPIYTNQTFHTIETPFVTVKTQEVFVEGVEVNVYPNPFQDQARIVVTNTEPGKKQLKIYSISGKEVSVQITDNQQFIFQRNNLPNGIYFYEISNKAGKIAVGKMIIQ